MTAAAVHPFAIACEECSAPAGVPCRIRVRDLYAAARWKLAGDPHPFIHLGRWFAHYPANVDWSAS